jgi:hypothetical protein
MATGNGWKINGLIVAIGVMVACAGVGADTNTLSLAPLTDAELIQTYEAAGLALAGTGREPTDGPCISSAPKIIDFGVEAIQAEILRRGSAVVPALIDFLEREVPQDRQAPVRGPAPSFAGNGALSFTGNALDFLARIGDTRGASITLRILEGWEGKATRWEQGAALDALERLTHVCFRSLNGNCANSVEHPTAIRAASFPDYATPARLYKQWMEGEGRDPTNWVGIATQRAREMLTSEDLEQVYGAAAFLQSAADHDTTPDATLARLADIVGKMKRGGKKGRYEFAGKPVPESIHNWLAMISNYGPRARPYAATLLRIQKEQGWNNWAGYAPLRKVGGPEVVSYLFAVLPEISAKADKISGGAEARAGFRNDDPQGWWLSSQREVRFGIDRWAGRVFDSDVDRLAWWEANKSRPPQEWLAANLEVVVAQADTGVLWAGWIVREVLPDLPMGVSDPGGNWWDPGIRRVEGPFRVKWLHEHRDALRYDANAGCFRLAIPVL